MVSVRVAQGFWRRKDFGVAESAQGGGMVEDNYRWDRPIHTKVGAKKRWEIQIFDFCPTAEVPLFGWIFQFSGPGMS